MLEQLQKRGTRLTRLRAKLAARKSMPGYEKNTGAIEAEIARLENLDLTTVPSEPEVPEPPAVASRSKVVKRHRSAETGRFIPASVAEANPATTVSERVKK